MRRFLLLVLPVSLLWIGLRAEPQTWTRAEDGRSIEATLLDYQPDTAQVRLRLANGAESTLDAAILTDENRQRLLAWRAQEDARLERERRQHAERVERARVGRFEQFVPDNGGGHAVHVYLPPGYVEGDPANASRPVAFLFSPGGHSRSIVNRLRPAADELGWVLVGVDAYRNTRSTSDRYEERMLHTRAAFEETARRYVFDPRKIVFGGMSGGGWWSYQCAAELTQQAAGVISFGGWMGNMYNKRYSRRMAVAMVNGDKDGPAINYERPDGDVLRSQANALEVRVFRFDGGHVLAPAETATEAARWLHRRKQF